MFENLRERQRGRRRPVVEIVAIVLVGMHILSGPVCYWSRDIEATILDEETRRPVAGAAVLVLWEAENFSSSRVWVREAVTDARVHFTVAPTFHICRPFERMAPEEPEIWIYQPRYEAVHLDDTGEFGSGATSNRWSTIRDSFWNHRRIGLARPKSVRDQVSSYADWIEMGDIRSPEHLDPGHYPLFWSAARAGYAALPAGTNAPNPDELIATWRGAAEAR